MGDKISHFKYVHLQNVQHFLHKRFVFSRSYAKSVMESQILENINSSKNAYRINLVATKVNPPQKNEMKRTDHRIVK